MDSPKHQKKLPPLNLRSHDQESPSAIQNGSRSPSPVAIVKPMFQSPKPQSSHRQQASVGPAIVEVLPLAQPVSPPQSHAHYSNQQQQRLNFTENAKIRDNPQTVDNSQIVKDEEHDDRPFDPNLVCPTCNQQFRIGEIQEHRKHYKLCSVNKQNDLDPVRHNVCTCRCNIIIYKLLNTYHGVMIKSIAFNIGIC